MKHLNTINQLKESFYKICGIDAALLYGSYGRNEATPNSDIDIQLLVNKDFETKYLTEELYQIFHNEIQAIREVMLRNKVVVYFKTQPKMELAICSNISEIDRNYLGSEILNIEETILYQRIPHSIDLVSYLTKLTSNKKQNKISSDCKKQANELIDKFIYEFESCSSMHRRSDGYQFYYFYNIALHIAIQLNHLSKGLTRFNFLPKYFIANVLTKEEQNQFYDLKGSLFLPEANHQKRKLLDFFYSAVQTLISTDELIEIKRFCEWIYDRDFLWNFRDISTHNPVIKQGIIFRSATMTLFQNEKRFNDFLLNKKIKTVIDLRAEREIDEMSYSDKTLAKFRYIKAPLDPWNQPDWFKQNYHYGSDEEIAYRFFAIGCNDKIKSIMEAILNEKEGSVAIHCFAGKDRTGIIVSLIHLLSDASIETLYTDYLASEVDVKLFRLDIVLKIINEKGGVVPYLLFCGLSENQILQLKSKLINEK